MVDMISHQKDFTNHVWGSLRDENSTQNSDSEGEENDVEENDVEETDVEENESLFRFDHVWSRIGDIGAFWSILVQSYAETSELCHSLEDFPPFDRADILTQDRDLD